LSLSDLSFPFFSFPTIGIELLGKVVDDQKSRVGFEEEGRHVGVLTGSECFTVLEYYSRQLLNL
jgi:hypothetical protein